ncbi:MAG: sigma-54 dependent transcriptional regulator [Candidatus Alcyoniella australis]|nr:sigma-54 dependent transcriptional regulator [Candidatus Alcyoniella australis]
MKNKLLVIDSDIGTRKLISKVLEQEGYEVDSATSGSAGLATFFERRHMVVLCELKMSGISGQEVLKSIKDQAPQTEVIIMTAYGSVEEAVRVMRLGAQDYLAKPFTREDLVFTVRRAFDKSALAHDNLRLKSALADRKRADLVGSSKTWLNVLDLVERIGPTNATVLLTGESGTGKELIASALHGLSDRSAKPYVALSCTAIPATLLESELFGHTKGSFTGAVREQKGKFELAHTGTIFLDEVGSMPMELQSKLLRVLQERQVDPIGARQPKNIDVRVIAATNTDLKQAVRNKNFREDLFYRLNVIPIHVPPLRERIEDVPLLLRYFIKKYGGDRFTVEPEVDRRLAAYSWPGNVRELENFAQRLVHLSNSEHISLNQLQQGLMPGAGLKGFSQEPVDEFSFVLPEQGVDLEQIERLIIQDVLQRTNNNKSRAARFLGIERHVLLYRLKKFGIDIDRTKSER